AGYGWSIWLNVHRNVPRGSGGRAERIAEPTAQRKLFCSYVCWTQAVHFVSDQLPLRICPRPGSGSSRKVLPDPPTETVMPKLVPDKLIEALVPDPSQLKHLTRRVGWVGKSTREGFARLYLNLNLNSYLEFRE